MDNPILVIVCAILGPIAMYFLWTRADKIRASRLWFAGAIAWIYAAAYTVGSWSVLLGKAGLKPIPEEVFVPCFFGFMMVVIAITFYINVYRPYRKAKKDYS